MNEPRSLKHRIRRSYYLLTTLLCIAFVTIFLITEEYVEQNILYKQLSLVLKHATDNHIDSFSKNDFGGDFLLYKGEQIPEDLRRIPKNGSVREVKVDGQELAVLSDEIDGTPFVITYHHHQLEQLEMLLLVILTVTTAAGLLVAFIFSRITLGLTIRPLMELSSTVEKGDLKNSPLLLQNDEIGFVSRAIAEKDRKLNDYFERERNFTGDVSHELRTPLAVIQGAAEVLESQFGDNTNALPHLKRIHRTTQDAVNLVSALLLLARSPAEVDFPRTNLSDLISQEIDHYTDLIARKPVRCKRDIQNDVHAYVRPEFARVAFGNLIRNAFRYTECGHVIVQLDSHGMVVQDTGPGVPESVQSSIFEQLNRGADKSGTGLGLNIVSRICQCIGWEIEYSKQADGGSRFALNFHDSSAS